MRDVRIDVAEIEAAIVALTSDMSQSASGASGPKSGVYTVRLVSPALLAPFKEGEGGLIYCGMTSDCAVREFDTHFKSDQTGFSTLRRSLGAILKAELKLLARPRGAGRSSTDFTNYRFDLAGEERLTDWMRENLRVCTWASRSHKVLEAELRRRLRPLLNLEAWNPHNAAIRKLRRVCANEARVLTHAEPEH